MSRDRVRYNRALYIDGKAYEAWQIHSKGFGKTGWVCIDDKCRVRMIPRAFRPTKEDGTAYKMTAHFRTDGQHKPGCNGTKAVRGGSSNKPPERQNGPPEKLPTRVLFGLEERLPHWPQAPALHSSLGRQEPAVRVPPLREHEHTTRSILEACHCYAAYPGKRRSRLRVQSCEGRTYRDVFVLLGTHDPSVIGSSRILYSQIHVMTRIDLAPNRLVIPLHYPDWIHTKKLRRLVVDTADWGDVQRQVFVDDLSRVLSEGRQAYKSGMPERAWVFFIGLERDPDQVEYEFTHPAAAAAIAVLTWGKLFQDRSIRFLG